MRKALLIGVASYDESRSGLKVLRTPVLDARALSDVLGSDKHGQYQVEVLGDPSCDEMRRRVESFFKLAHADDELLFYYSGHGRLSSDGGLLLCARDSEGPKITSSTLRATDVAEWTQSCPCRCLVMIFDCCFSGQVFGDGMKSGQCDEPVKSAISTTLMPGRGKYILTSSGRYQSSLELPSDTNSLFTKWLLRGLLGDADLNRDGKISVDELFAFVHPRVIEERPDQIPEYLARADTPLDTVLAFAPQSVRRSSAPTTPLNGIERLLSRHWAEGRLVPFLGHSIYGDSALGENALSVALNIENVRNVASPIATVAEHFYLERNRDELVEQLSAELEAGERDAVDTIGSKLLENIAANERLNLIVVATYDHLLERALDAMGRRYVQLTHILESGPEWHQSVGKVAVVEGDHCEICNGDEAPLPKDTLVIYRPLGSPRLNQVLTNASDRQTDTVVITETDHLRFGRIYAQDAAFPTVLSSRLQDKRLLFLGYTLDVWHYRFVIRMLAKQGASNREPWAVRQAMDSIEKKCWEKLGAKIVDNDLTTLLSRVLSKPEVLHAG